MLSAKHCGSLKKIADRGKHVCKSLDGNSSLCVYIVLQKKIEINFESRVIFIPTKYCRNHQ